MSTKNTLIISLVLIVTVTLVGLALWSRFPERMASHWNIEDQVDGYISRFWGVFLLPVTTLVMLLLFLIIPQIDPLKKNIGEFRPTFNLFILFLVGFMVYIHILTLVFNLGYNFPMSRAMLPAMSLLFYYIGVLMKKARRNWFIGIRTPWTLSSDMVWVKTHRLGAVLFKVCAGLVILGALLGGEWAFLFTIAPLIVSTIFLAVYSYVVYQREMAENS